MYSGVGLILSSPLLVVDATYLPFCVYAYDVGWTFDLCPLSCEMAAAFVIIYKMKHCIACGMDLLDFPLAIIEAFFNEKTLQGCVRHLFCVCMIFRSFTESN